MRMGITEPERTSTTGKNKTQPVLKPKNTPDKAKDEPPSVRTIGRISPNLIDAIYIPLLTHIAERQAEQYAESLLIYEESLKEHESSTTTDTTDADLEDILNDKSTPPTIPPKPSPSSYLFATAFQREELQSQILTPTSLYFTTPTPGRSRSRSRKSGESTNSSSSTPAWKVHANAAKFERLLDEKYGRLRPFLTQHPEIETFIRTTQRRFAKGEIGSPFRQEKGPLDLTSSIMILFLMHRGGVRWQVTGLGFLFLLVGLQPWALVCCVTVGRWVMRKKKKKMPSGWLVTHKKEIKVVAPYYAKVTRVIGDMGDGGTGESEREAIKKVKHDFLLKPIGQPIATDDNPDYFNTGGGEGEEKYDTLVVGSGPATLFTASLLSRTGRTVLVLSPSQCASGVETMISSADVDPNDKKTTENLTKMKFKDVAFDIQSSHVAHTTRMQQFLAPALCTDTDAQGGIRFAAIGTEADGYTSDLLSIPGMGVTENGPVAKDECIPFPIRAGGLQTLAEDAALFLHDGWPTIEGDEGSRKTIGNSLTAAYVNSLADINASATMFYMNKAVQQPGTKNETKFSKSLQSSNYKQATLQWTEDYAARMLALNPHIRSLMAGIGMRGENLPPRKTSFGPHITNICAVAGGDGVGEGFTYPVGGTRALCRAFATVIEQNGGKIVTGADIGEFVFAEEADAIGPEVEGEEMKEAPDAPKPRCFGVKLLDNRLITVGTHEDSAVVSMVGFFQTFLFNMNPHIRTKYGVPDGLPIVAERRPQLHFLLGLEGDSTDLSITGADWYRLPAASLARDEIDPATGAIKSGTIGADWDDDEIDENVNNDITATNNQPDINTNTLNSVQDKHARKPKKKRRNKFVSGTSWMKVSFPSAKDPSFHERHPGISTCVVTVEADDDFVTKFATNPAIYSNAPYGEGESQRLMERVINKDLLINFPQLEGKIRGCVMKGPIRMGLSHTPMRYAAPGIQPNTEYPGLYMGGSDITVGDSFSMSMIGGWMAANAVVKYGLIDNFLLHKNITADLAQYLASPKNVKGVEDIAVPFEPPVNPESNVKDNVIDERQEEDKGSTDSTKEEINALHFHS